MLIGHPLAVDEMTNVFTGPVIDIMLCCILNKMIKSNDKDPP